MPARCLLLLLDGIGDRSHAVLDYQTPLQAASTPNLDRIARAGMCGLFHASCLGEALPSEDAHFAMFGYDIEDFPGRGAVEALGAGIDLRPGDVAILSHLVYAEEKDGALVLTKDRPDAPEEVIEALCRSIAEYETEGVKIRYHRTRKLDGIIVLSGDVSRRVTDTDPVREGAFLMEVFPWSNADPAAGKTARVLKKYLIWCRDRLAGQPANALATQRAGKLEKPLQPFSSRFGLRGLSISAGIVYWGLGRLLGLDVIEATTSKDPGKDLDQRLDTAISKLNSHDFIHVHTKAPDRAAHAKDPLHKKNIIESLDRALSKTVDRLLGDPETLLVVTADHSTPSAGPLIHSGEPVPLVFARETVRRDGVSGFDEVSCAHGALGTVRGSEMMKLVLNFLDRAKLRGLMDTPDDQLHWPGDYEPFKVK